MFRIKNILKNLFSPIDEEAGALANLPNSLIRLSIFMSLNAIFQAILDVIVESLILLELVSIKIDLRVEFLSLTLISTVIAYLTLVGIRHGNLDITQNTLLLGLLVESSLVIGDLYLLFNTTKDFWPIFFFRLIFIILTSTNIYIISTIMINSRKIKHRRPNPRF